MIKTIKFHEKCFKLLNSWSITFEFFNFMKTFLKFYKFMNNVFNIFQLQGKYIYRTCKNKFEGKLSKSNFKSNEIHLISNMKLFDHCSKSCTWMSGPLERTARRCSCTDSWCTGPRWTRTRHSRARWDMLWSPHKHMAYGMIVDTKARIQQWVTQMLRFW